MGGRESIDEKRECNLNLIYISVESHSSLDTFSLESASHTNTQTHTPPPPHPPVLMDKALVYEHRLTVECSHYSSFILVDYVSAAKLKI